MIVIPPKKAYELNISHPLKQFIQQTYTTNLDDYLKSVDALNQLRNEALFKTNRQERLSTKRYIQISLFLCIVLQASQVQAHSRHQFKNNTT